MLSISVVIPAYNEEKCIGACLESVLRHRTPDVCEVVVVDNASTDATAAIASSYSGVRVVREPRKGLTRARQRGLQEIRGDLYASLDSDTLVPEGWFPRIGRAFAHDPALVCLSGPCWYYDLPLLQRHVFWWGWRLVSLLRRPFGAEVSGSNFVVRRSVLLRCGFPTEIEFYGEDVQLARQLEKMGRMRFSMSFFVFASGRRFVKGGLFRTIWLYAVNLYAIQFHGKPQTTEHRDYR
jgi:glycosyltransferase involved in cell wall biosynthesis